MSSFHAVVQGADLAVHQGQVGIASAGNLREEPLDELGQGARPARLWVGGDVAQHAPTGRVQHRPVVGGLGREVVEEQAARDPRLGRNLVQGEFLDGAIDELAQADPDELPPALVRREAGDSRSRAPANVLRHLLSIAQ